MTAHSRSSTTDASGHGEHISFQGSRRMQQCKPQGPNAELPDELGVRARCAYSKKDFAQRALSGSGDSGRIPVLVF